MKNLPNWMGPTEMGNLVKNADAGCSGSDISLLTLANAVSLICQLNLTMPL